MFQLLKFTTGAVARVWDEVGRREGVWDVGGVDIRCDEGKVRDKL